MKIIVQRVKSARVEVADKLAGSIGKGMLLFVGIAEGDTHGTVNKMADRLSAMRIFEDSGGKMNLDVSSVGGAVLNVPQFTLLADTSKGTRPGFSGAASPRKALALWKDLSAALRERGLEVSEGVFGAHMEVSLVNDGPVTFIITSKESAPEVVDT
ncbi:MAG: D-aminoacyl-tRNA deacylase [Candidatus Omnitrophica bacterium]|nr:D-aminoacyl-tRNA deacylase [Candidatus Omnitrophota bacterium]